MAGTGDTRRVNGQGSKPFQRAGRRGWYSFVRVTDARTGEAKRVLVSAATKTALATKVRETLQAADAGLLAGAATRVTVADYALRWESEHLPARDVTPGTRRLYKHALRNYVLPAIGGMRLDRVRAGDVERIDARLQGLGLSSSTRRLAYNVAHAMFVTAVRDRLLKLNPADGVARPSDPPRTQPHYSPDQLRVLLAAVQGERVLEQLLPLMLWTGVRPGEALAVQWSDVDLEAGLLAVRATLATDEEGRVYRQQFTKTKKSHLVPLLPPAAAALKAAKAAQAADRLAAGEAWEDHGLVFSNELGQLLDDRDLRKRYAPLVKSLGLTGSLHALRRSTGTQLTAAGVPLGVVAEILGHSSTAVTQAHYTVVDVAMMREALSALEKRFTEEAR